MLQSISIEIKKDYIDMAQTEFERLLREMPLDVLGKMLIDPQKLDYQYRYYIGRTDEDSTSRLLRARVQRTYSDTEPFTEELSSAITELNDLMRNNECSYHLGRSDEHVRNTGSSALKDAFYYEQDQGETSVTVEQLVMSAILVASTRDFAFGRLKEMQDGYLDSSDLVMAREVGRQVTVLGELERVMLQDGSGLKAKTIPLVEQ